MQTLPSGRWPLGDRRSGRRWSRPLRDTRGARRCFGISNSLCGVGHPPVAAATPARTNRRPKAHQKIRVHLGAPRSGRLLGAWDRPPCPLAEGGESPAPSPADRPAAAAARPRV